MAAMREARFTDIHHHVLFGLDDGPQTAADMEKMLDAAARDGIGAIIATPHAAPGIRPFDMTAYRQRLEAANRCCQDGGLPLRVLGGSEIMFTQATVRFLQERRAPTMNNTRFVLIEHRPGALQEEIGGAIRDLANAGFIPILAHAERYRALWGRVGRLAEMKSAFDMRIQINCAALLKRNAFFPGRFVSRLLDAGLVDYVASDAHDTLDRRTLMRSAREALTQKYGAGYADALTRENQNELGL